MRRFGFATLDVATLIVTACAVVVTGLAIRDRLVTRSGINGAACTEIKDWEAYAAEGHHVGPKDAPVTLVEFVDYQCPACAVFAGTLTQVRAAHPNDLAVVYRHWPLPIHPNAVKLARAAECAADQGAFEAFHDFVFQERDSIALLTMAQVGARVGIKDTATFAKCSERTTRLPVIDRDVAAVKRLGGRGTPTILVNNKRLAMVPDSARLEELIRQAKSDR